MKTDLTRALDKQRAENTPIALDLSLKEIAIKFLASHYDWLGRQVLKLLAPALAALSAYLNAKGVSDMHVTAIVAGIGAGVLGVIEMVCSWISRKNARKAEPILD